MEISSKGCTHPAQRVGEKIIPLLDCTDASREISSKSNTCPTRQVEEKVVPHSIVQRNPEKNVSMLGIYMEDE